VPRARVSQRNYRGNCGLVSTIFFYPSPTPQTLRKLIKSKEEVKPLARSIYREAVS
jgi:hypothetical protein